jgi:uncharacterized protein YgbK (DUF1537 family)
MRCCILADDLTGANATAALLKREGLPTHTHLFAHAPHGNAPASLRHDGAHVLDLDTRERTDAEATARLAVATAWLGDTPDLIGLRTDSTLRGPITASLDTLRGFLLAGGETAGGLLTAFGGSQPADARRGHAAGHSEPNHRWPARR